MRTQCRNNLLWRNRQESKQKLSQWVLHLLKQISKLPPQMTLFWGSTGPASGTSRENLTSTTDRRCWFCPQHRWAQGFPKLSLSQNSAPISIEEPILRHLPHSPISTCVFTFQTGCGLSRAEIKAYSSFKLNRGLMSCLMNNWRGIESVSHLVIQLFATPWTLAHQAPLSMGILQARILEWVDVSSSRGSFIAQQKLRSEKLKVKSWKLWNT